MGIHAGQSFSTAVKHYENFDQSVAFKLCLENYTNQHLKDPHYVDHSGQVYDRPQPVAPNMAELMTGHQGDLSGVSGVVSWDIGDTGKMLVLLYDKQGSDLGHKSMLAIGIFPRGDLTTLYEKMHSGEEDGFKRQTFPDQGGGIRPIRFGDDPDYKAVGQMGDAPKSLIDVIKESQDRITKKIFEIYRSSSTQRLFLAWPLHNLNMSWIFKKETRCQVITNNNQHHVFSK